MTAGSGMWNGWGPANCELGDGRPIAGEIAEVKLCQRCIDVALHMGELQRERTARAAA